MWNAVIVKAIYNYQCTECGSTENIQAHDPTGKHTNIKSGIALCGICHSKKHPKVPQEIFLKSDGQSYWPNKSAASIAKDLGCHNRTVIRRAKKLQIPKGITINNDHIERLRLFVNDNLYRPAIKIRRMPNDTATISHLKDLRQKLGLSQEQMATIINVSFVSLCNWEAGKTKPSNMAREKLEQLVSEVPA